MSVYACWMCFQAGKWRLSRTLLWYQRACRWWPWSRLRTRRTGWQGSSWPSLTCSRRVLSVAVLSSVLGVDCEASWFRVCHPSIACFVLALIWSRLYFESPIQDRPWSFAFPPCTRWTQFEACRVLPCVVPSLPACVWSHLRRLLTLHVYLERLQVDLLTQRHRISSGDHPPSLRLKSRC